jgi:hypothetical protein
VCEKVPPDKVYLLDGWVTSDTELKENNRAADEWDSAITSGVFVSTDEKFPWED